MPRCVQAVRTGALRPAARERRDGSGRPFVARGIYRDGDVRPAVLDCFAMCSRRIAVIVALVAILCAGCKVDATTSIKLDKDGGGAIQVRVQFDAEAGQVIERRGGKIEDRIVLADLRDDGWRVSRWRRRPDRGAVITLAHPFEDAAQLGDLVSGLSGPNGVLRDVHVTRSRNVIEQRDGISMVADL